MMAIRLRRVTSRSMPRRPSLPPHVDGALQHPVEAAQAAGGRQAALGSIDDRIAPAERVDALLEERRKGLLFRVVEAVAGCDGVAEYENAAAYGLALGALRRVRGGGGGGRWRRTLAAASSQGKNQEEGKQVKGQAHGDTRRNRYRQSSSNAHCAPMCQRRALRSAK